MWSELGMDVPPPTTNLYEYQKKRVAKKAMRKNMKTKGGLRQGYGAASGIWKAALPTPPL
jgi:hypothetical protein